MEKTLKLKVDLDTKDVEEKIKKIQSSFNDPRIDLISSSIHSISKMFEMIYERLNDIEQQLQQKNEQEEPAVIKFTDKGIVISGAKNIELNGRKVEI